MHVMMADLYIPGNAVQLEPATYFAVIAEVLAGLLVFGVKRSSALRVSLFEIFLKKGPWMLTSLASLVYKRRSALREASGPPIILVKLHRAPADM